MLPALSFFALSRIPVNTRHAQSFIVDTLSTHSHHEIACRWFVFALLFDILIYSDFIHHSHLHGFLLLAEAIHNTQRITIFHIWGISMACYCAEISRLLQIFLHHTNSFSDPSYFSFYPRPFFFSCTSRFLALSSSPVLVLIPHYLHRFCFLFFYLPSVVELFDSTTLQIFKAPFFFISCSIQNALSHGTMAGR